MTWFFFHSVVTCRFHWWHLEPWWTYQSNNKWSQWSATSSRPTWCPSLSRHDHTPGSIDWMGCSVFEAELSPTPLHSLATSWYIPGYQLEWLYVEKWKPVNNLLFVFNMTNRSESLLSGKYFSSSTYSLAMLTILSASWFLRTLCLMSCFMSVILSSSLENMKNKWVYLFYKLIVLVC